MKKKPDDDRWVAVCQYNFGANFHIFTGTYDEVLAEAGKYWQRSDLSFDMDHPDKFYVDPESGYSEDVDIMMHSGKRDKNKIHHIKGKRDKNKIYHISHSFGDGTVITIQRPEN